jgi:hypothetical protein
MSHVEIRNRHPMAKPHAIKKKVSGRGWIFVLLNGIIISAQNIYSRTLAMNG